MSYNRPGLKITIAQVADGGSLPDVVDDTSGVDLAPLTVGLASAVTADTARALPTTCTLYMSGGPAETVTVLGPLKLKGYRGAAWYSLGYLFDGVAAATVSDLDGHPAEVAIPPGVTRLALISEGAGPHVSGGTLTVELEASIAVDHGRLP